MVTLVTHMFYTFQPLFYAVLGVTKKWLHTGYIGYRLGYHSYDIFAIKKAPEGAKKITMIFFFERPQKIKLPSVLSCGIIDLPQSMLYYN